MTRQRLGAPNLLRDARVYLSGPMDFVASRSDEKRFGWRNRVSEFLQELGVTVFDPWFKPEIRGTARVRPRRRDHYQRSADRVELQTGTGGRARACRIADGFWPMQHVDLRMVDTSDFVVSYCPTNVYSVGTPHEIILCRQQRKPVLFVSPYVTFPALAELQSHLTQRRDARGWPCSRP